MGTHSDGVPVTRSGFDGPYWAAKAAREAAENSPSVVSVPARLVSTTDGDDVVDLLSEPMTPEPPIEAQPKGTQ